MTFTYEYPRGALTVDCVVFGINLDSNTKLLDVLMIRRANDPYKDYLALPGGFVNMDEDVSTAASRELEEETGAKISYMEQLFTFSEPKRDPRERVVSVSHFALVRSSDHNVVGGDDASEAMWISINNLRGASKTEPLAFDHSDIIELALKRLQSKIRYSPIGFNLLPDIFTIPQMQKLYEIILMKRVEPKNFHKKILKLGVLKEVGVEDKFKGRPAKQYQFNQDAYDKAIQDGFNFEIKLENVK